ncbi:hypothetical protein GCM10009127_23090 [Alteraurantiacibacter aestuarii]|uniref:serine hydrolase domain-containing protein n=1 Tax=Alteraurantiacibacter aestuarii TaxID=650004 RepID=UPI0031D01C01
MTFKRALLLVSGFLPVAMLFAANPAHARSDNVEGVFQEWLTAFNSGDRDTIAAFYGEYLGNPQPTLAMDIAQDTCGLDVVRVESRSEQAISVLLVERCFPLLHRLEIELGAPGDAHLKRLLVRNFALTSQATNAALAGIADRLSQRGDFVGSLLVADGDGQTLARAWGFLDDSEQTPITLDTPMFLASAGKMFTAVAVLQLAEDGLIALDAPLGQYLTDYPDPQTAQVTIRQLLSHRGGTGDIGILGRDEGANRASVRTIADIIALNGNRAPAFEPGSQMAYSNYGFVLLGAVVERVSGQDYYDYVAANIFGPAGMSNAGYPDLDHLQGVAAGYTTFFGEQSSLVSNFDTLPWRGTPAGGGVASANDMLKFFNALRAGTLITLQSLAMATSAEEGGWYGMGFTASPGGNGSWGHGGNAYGMNVAAQYDPALDTTFICLASRDAVCDHLIYSWLFRRIGLTQ